MAKRPPANADNVPRCSAHHLPPAETHHPVLGWLRYIPSHDDAPAPSGARYRCSHGCEWDPDNPQPNPASAPQPQQQPTATTREQQAREYVARALTHIRTPLKAEFLVGLRFRGSVVHACEFAGIGRTQAYEWRKQDPDFAQAWEAVLEDATDALEASMYERGLSGDGMPSVVAGLAWLKTRRPVWNDKVQAALALRDVIADNPAVQALERAAAHVERLLRERQQQQQIIEGQAQQLPAPGSPEQRRS